ncbi:stress responsive alpha-beta barrel domain protein [Rhodoferax antarcticus ANT.BR]|uniref:Stress responsive alpha-beta barrel domain protein n=1 Tax=Rhodoferax antarcticus ANT.BR TaxID=1111071 RepID=A0A1Q8YES4_9BURK|nr:stress responsive alpha-beta barrel domain protein [Rhodoferax antarcticus ANT.BR]
MATAQLGHECTYDLVLNSVFEDAEALNAYQSHPEHAAIKPFLGAIRTERQCMDYTHPAP